MALLKVTKVYPDGTTEDVTPVEEVNKPATRRKARASKDSKKNKNNKVWENLKKKIEALDNKTVDVGYPADATGSGVWDNRSGMTYGALAYIHANANRLGLDFPTRDVMTPIKPFVGGALNSD